MDTAPTVTARRPTISAPEFVATFVAAVLLVIVLLYIDMNLARIDRRESRTRAARLYRDGISLFAKGDAKGAGDRFASAVAIERGNTTYALALVDAYVAAGRREEAQRDLDALLERSGNDGAVNLAKARMVAGSADPGDAPIYYHRAIYGRWGQDSTSARRDARFELVEVLAARGDTVAMLAELLPIEAMRIESPTVQRRLAHLFIAAGSPRRSIPILRTLLRENPRDADAYAALGAAALNLGHFETARADLRAALRLRPDDVQSAERLALSDSILALDPRARGISARQRAARANLLIVLVIAERERCAGHAPAGDTAEAARRLGITPAHISTEALEALAVQMWASRSRCTPAFAANRALALLLASMEQ